MSPPPASERADQSDWFASEVQPHEGALRAYLHRRFPKIRDQDDLVQDTFVGILLAVRRKRQIGSAKNYLFGIARQLAYGLFKKKSLQAEILVGDFAILDHLVDDTDTLALVEASADRQLVVDAIARLPSRCREILMLWAFEGLAPREISEKLGISDPTVRIQLSRGIDKITRHLTQHGILREKS